MGHNAFLEPGFIGSGLLHSFYSPLLCLVKSRRSSQPATDIFCKIMKVVIRPTMQKDLISNATDHERIIVLRKAICGSKKKKKDEREFFHIHQFAENKSCLFCKQIFGVKGKR